MNLNDERFQNGFVEAVLYAADNGCVKFLLGTKDGTSVCCHAWSIAFFKPKGGTR
jgi:hypothetical protein